MSLILKRLVVGPLQENCYMLACPVTKEAVLVDPGEEAERLLAAVEEKELALRAIWLTHAHFDHVGAIAAIKERHDVPVHMHPADAPLLERAAESAAQWQIPLRQPPTGYTPLEPDQELILGELRATCLFTPGHAPGHISFYLPEHNAVIAGDALFRGSIGRTDLPFGDHEQLIESIRKELLTLPDETVVLPGHGPETTVAQEKHSNPFLR